VCYDCKENIVTDVWLAGWLCTTYAAHGQTSLHLFCYTLVVSYKTAHLLFFFLIQRREESKGIISHAWMGKEYRYRTKSKRDSPNQGSNLGPYPGKRIHILLIKARCEGYVITATLSGLTNRLIG